MFHPRLQRIQTVRRQLGLLVTDSSVGSKIFQIRALTPTYYFGQKYLRYGASISVQLDDHGRRLILGETSQRDVVDPRDSHGEYSCSTTVIVWRVSCTEICRSTVQTFVIKTLISRGIN